MRPSHSYDARWRSPRRAVGPEHPGTATIIYNLGNFLREQGKFDEAEEFLKRGGGIRQ